MKLRWRAPVPGGSPPKLVRLRSSKQQTDEQTAFARWKRFKDNDGSELQGEMQVCDA
jgi:hypothetical protein